jgi:hypothetical protein
MTKVFKRTGAVAIYSGWRAMLAIGSIVLVLLGAGFAAGFLVADDSDEDAARQAGFEEGRAAGRADARAYVRTTSAKDDSRRAAESPEKPRPTGSYRSGFRDGVRAVAGTGSDLRPGRAYIVMVDRGRGRAPFTIARDIPVRPGFLYRLCSGGNSICERAGG